MTPLEWQACKNLSPSGFGEPSRIDLRLGKALNSLIPLIGKIHVDCGTQGAHLKGSEHYLGTAVDFIIPTPKLSWTDTFIAITRFPFNGIGYYPEWKLNGEKLGGWHLDVRSLTEAAPWGHRWLGLPDPERVGEQLYLALNAVNLKAAGIVL